LRLRDIPPGKIGVSLAILFGVFILLAAIGLATGNVRVEAVQPPVQVVVR
jgi:hypothetical protein